MKALAELKLFENEWILGMGNESKYFLKFILLVTQNTFKC